MGKEKKYRERESPALNRTVQGEVSPHPHYRMGGNSHEVALAGF